jgi:amino acid adenylation domain-containing protein/non-ribosomal peptide synthase protein (TIGR01720 family)
MRTRPILEDVYPLTPMQEGMLFHTLLAQESGAYFEQLTCTLRAPLDVQALQEAWRRMLARHSVLRTRFAWQGMERPLQVVLRQVPLPWDLRDWRGIGEADEQAQFEAFLEEDRRRGFTLEEAPLLRLTLLRTREDAYRFVFSFHHLLLDGWSLPIVLKELAVCYAALRRGDEPQLAPVRPYRNYLAWLEQQDGAAAERFWRGTLEGLDGPTELGIERAQPSGAAGYSTQELALSPELTNALRSFTQTRLVTQNTLVQGLWAILLSRYSGQEEVVFGATVSGRPTDLFGADSMVGVFINTLPVRVRVPSGSALIPWLKTLQAKNAEMRQHQHSPLVQIQGWSQVPRGVPLFRSILVFENYPVDASLRDRGGPLAVTDVRFLDHTNYPITVIAKPGPPFALAVSYDQQRFEGEAVRRLLGHFQALLESALTQGEAAVGELAMIGRAERAELLAWSGAAVSRPSERTVVDRFEEQASRAPDAVAVVFEDLQLTYGELNSRANQLARRLRDLGVGPERLVGLLAERSLELVVGILGILKAGGAYLPLDPSYPRERIALMLEDAQASVIIGPARRGGDFSGLSAPWVDLDAGRSPAGPRESENLPRAAGPENLAYVIYTSGSTGKPKGVPIQHSQIERLLTQTEAWYGFTSQDVWTLFHSCAFDFSVWELWGCLAYGGKLVVVPQELTRNLRDFYRMLCDRKVTVLNLTPSAFKAMALAEDELPADLQSRLALSWIIFGGEALEVASLAPWFRRHGDQKPRLVNMYGITETTVHVTYRPLSESDLGQPTASPIGDPIPDLQVFILDENLCLAPIGVPGEIYVGGAGVARGYLGRPALTAERFVPNPFSRTPGERLYRSGDRARRLEGGQLEFLGRTDRQVKIRGFRVELGEVESALAQHPAIREAVVLIQESHGKDKRLVAYFVASPEIAASELREFLRQRLPEYMVPTGLVPLAAMPLTNNGKIDRKALPPLDGERLGLEVAYTAPRTPTEEILAGLWSQLLGVEQVGIHDSFFELGGHSLLATQVASRVREVLHVELPLRVLFEHRTVAGVAEYIDREHLRTGESPIEPTARDGAPPLSFAQQRLWFLSHLDSEGASYNLPAAVRLRGRLDIPALERALSEVVHRHESLRTTFAEVEGRAMQVVAPSLTSTGAVLGPSPVDEARAARGARRAHAHRPVTDEPRSDATGIVDPATGENCSSRITLAIPRQDLSREPDEVREERLRREAADEARRPFDLARGPLLRARLLVLGEEDHVVLLTMHHIVSDGWSMGVLIREIAALYEAFVAGKPSPLAPLAIQYVDFAQWQRQWLEGERIQEQLSYWKQKLAGAPALELPLDRPRPPVQTFHGASHRFALPEDLAAGIRRLCRAQGVTLYMALLAAFKALLTRVTGQTDLCIGSPIANRNRAELEGLIGFFVNTLVLRTDLSNDPPFCELLARVRESALGAYAHQDLPFERLVEELAPIRDLSRTPLFQVVFSLQSAPLGELELSGLTLSPIPIESGASKFDLTLEVTESAGNLRCAFEFNTDLFERSSIERLAGQFTRLLESAVADPKRRIGELALLSDEERETLLSAWNRTDREFPREQTVVGLFEDQVAKAPEAIAVVFEEERLSYGELDSRANRLARRLVELGAGPDCPVGILLPRSSSMVVAQLAVLKAGAAYLPLDPSYPAERLRFMLGDSRARVLLTRQDLLDDLRLDAEIRVVCMDRDLAALAPETAGDRTARASPRDLAYVIYTSGSTGTPKGVAVEHRALMRLVAWHVATYEMRSGTRAAQLAGPAFDAAAWELWPALASGASIAIVTDEVRLSPARLLEWLAAQRIAIAFAPTALAEVLIRQPLPQGLALEILLTGGDKLQRGVPPGLPFSVVNHYGPTESAVVTTCARVGDEPLPGAPPIGRPIDNTKVYVLDRRRELVPVGAAGELCIGGEGLARGYWHHPRLTAEQFIPDPFGARPGGRLYCTGDLVRYRADGNLEFLGRIDRQVKVRGFRVELGDIEAALAQHPAIREAVVVARTDRDGDKRLVGYFVASQLLGVGELRAFLARKIPEHMLPSAFIPLAAMPLTANGKIDRDALPSPDGARPMLEVAFAVPHTEPERALASIWSELLGVEQVGIHDNFFELGGDSILSIQVIARARQRGLTISPRQMFEHQTIASLAAAASSAPAIIAEQGPVIGPVPLTPIQAWFFDQKLPAPRHFNQSLVFEVEPGFRPELLRPCFERLLEHHDALRLRLRAAGSGWVQSIAEREEHDVVELVDLSTIPEPARPAAMEARANELQASLDLENGPILRVAFFGRGSGSPGRLLILVHHVAIDGVSWRILLEDLQSLYQSLSRAEAPVPSAHALPPKTTSFKHWAEHLREYARSDGLRQELSHWASIARRPCAAIPMDHSEGANTFGSVRHLTVGLEEKETQALLHEVPAAYRTQINDVLLTALSLTLARWSDGERILVELEGHGREELSPVLDLSRTVGWFTSLFPVALDLTRPEDLGATLKSVKEQIRSVPRKGIGYGILRYLSEDLQVSEALRPIPRPAVGFNYLGQARSFGPLRLAAESAGREHDPLGLRAHLLDITAVIKDGRLLATWMYSDQLHERQTVDRLAQSFLADLRRLIAHCLSPEVGGCTPSDFPLARLDQAGLDARFGPRRDLEDLYPLTPMQQGMLFHTLLAPDSGVYFEQFTCTIHAPFDPVLFELAWQRMLDRHSVLRSGFLWDGLDQPLQAVFKNVRVPLSHLDWRDLEEAEVRDRFDTFLQEDRRRGFDLSEAPLLRLTLIRVHGDAFRFVCAFHHLLLDGWSLSLALQELFASYSALRGAKEPSLQPAVPYRHYLEWISNQDPAAAERFWREELKGFEAPTALGIERAAPSGTPGHAEHEVALTPALTAGLQDFARAHKLTLNTVIQGLWALLLSRYSGRDDVLFGATVAGRPAELPGAEGMIGLFINTLPMRVRVPANARLVPWLRGLQAKSAEMRQYEHSPLVQVQSSSDLPRGVALFNHILVFENYPVDASLRDSGPLAVSEVRVHEHTNYPITVVAKPGPRLAIEISYDRQLVDSAAVERVLRHFTHLLEAAVADPAAELGDLPMLAPDERQRLLDEWNATEVPYPRDRTFVDLFEEQVVQAPDAPAVVFEGAQLTYSELNSRANQLARHLRALGVGPEALVGLCADRSLEMVVGVLAILKAGAAYVPLDPSYPRDRLALMLEDARVSVLVGQEPLLASLPHDSALIVPLDDPKALLAYPPQNPAPMAGPENLAYVIFTSGSTGRPKGVGVAHRGLCNLVTAQALAFGLGPRDRVLQVASLSFDASIWEIVMALGRGAALHLVPRHTLLSTAELAEAIQSQGISAATFPPSLLSTLPPEKLTGMQTLVVAGEACSQELAARWTPGRRFYNAYGPSEATVCATIHPCAANETTAPPIGQPIANTRVFVLDHRLRPVPVGVAGELYIGGEGVGRGYLRRPALTADRFIPDPFASEPGRRLYRTGDRVRTRADGRIEFLGRLDQQVKVRGFRVELGEVESTLARHPAIREAVVLAHGESSADRRLIAYYVPAEQQLPTSELREFLRRTLPEHMIPGAFVQLTSFPLSPNGKVNRNALPAPDGTRPDLLVDYAPPRTPTEELVAGIWAQVLRVKQVGVRDDFFELGGHSLLATQVASRVREAFKVRLPLRDLFEVRTVEELASRIDIAKGSGALEGDAIAPMPRKPQRLGGPGSPALQRPSDNADRTRERGS